MKSKEVNKNLGFKRGRSPKKTLGIGKLSTQILSELDVFAAVFNCVESKLEDRDLKKILEYGRIPPEIQAIVKVWELRTNKKIIKLVLYDERIAEDRMWGLKNAYAGLIFPWIFKLEWPIIEDGCSMCNRSEATKYLEDLKWHQEINF